MKLGFVTVASKNYLAHVRTLAASIRDHHDAPVYALFADEIDGYVDPQLEPFHVVQLQEVLPEQLRSITFYYTAFELRCALRPFLHRYILDHTDLDAWIFLDADIIVTAPLDGLFSGVDGPVLLSPHSLCPPPREFKEPVETSCFKHGLYNGGFLGLRRSVSTRPFIDWFQDRLVTHCFAYSRNAFVDQLWLNFIPIYFPAAVVVRHEGLNVGFWNLYERVLQRDSRGGYSANGQPLLFLHFSHWREDDPETLSNDWPVAKDTDRGVIAELGRTYLERLRANGLETCRRWPYTFATYTDGSRIPVKARRKYYEQVMNGTATGRSPFEMAATLGRESRLRQWARSMKRRGPRLNP